MRVEMVQKVASLLRERRAIDRRVANILGNWPHPDALASWVAAEVLDVTFEGEGPAASRPGRLPARSWCEGFGPAVRVRWHASGCSHRPQDDPQDSCTLDFFGAGRSSEDATPQWTVEWIELASPKVFGFNAPSRLVYTVGGSQPWLSPHQVAALRLLSATTEPVLTRYH